MIAYERRKFILQTLSSKGVVSLKELALKLDTSEITIRRDIEKLEAEGKLRRVQGGAASLEEAEEAELTMKQRLPIRMDVKSRIAAFAASRVQNGETVFLDAGTTMIPLAMELMNRNVTIVTYSTMFIGQMVNPTARIILIGGEYLPYYEMNVGMIAQDQVKQFYFDKAFLGCSGVDLDRRMVCSTEMKSLEMKRLAMQQAQRCFLVLDSSKFSARGFMRLCETSDFEELICDSFPGPEEKRPENLIAVDDTYSEEEK